MSSGLRIANVLIFALATVAGCSQKREDVKPENNGKATVSLLRGTVDLLSGSQFLTIGCNTSWRLEVDYKGAGEGEWIGYDAEEGQGNGLVRISWELNNGFDREADIRVIAPDTVMSVTLQQSGLKSGIVIPGWLELPAVQMDDHTVFVSHDVALNGKQVRNYSMLYNTELYMAHWVAYPLHVCYLGSAGRNDAWQYDSYVDRYFEGCQAKASSGYGDYVQGDLYSYDRGHQLPSADRTATEEMNQQTFYYTNITPQMAGLNQRKWGTLEDWVRNNAVNDTLYVVSGAVLRTVGGEETITYKHNNNDGKELPVPNYYYKVLLKSAGNGWTAIGFWFEHLPASGAITQSDACSVREIERRTGFNFFASLPAAAQEEAETVVDMKQWKW